MENATLKQAGKIISIFNETPLEQVQEILESGLLADLRDGNIAGVNREDFRRILGLKPLTALPESILGSIGKVVISAAKAFVVADKIKASKGRSGRNVYAGGNFDEWFLSQKVKATRGTKIQYYKLLKFSVDGPIISELGGEKKAETTLAEMFTLLDVQSNGEKGALLTNGYANIFYIRDIKGVLRAVDCRWLDGRWDLYASPMDHPDAWARGRQVFSRNSSEA